MYGARVVRGLDSLIAVEEAPTRALARCDPWSAQGMDSRADGLHRHTGDRGGGRCGVHNGRAGEE